VTHYSAIFPELLPDQYEALKASIHSDGVQVPVIVDQKGNLIDGRYRRQAAQELGIHCPTEVRQFSCEADKLETALSLNCRRRQLNRQQKRELIAAYLQADPAIANNHLAELIGGVSQNTVATVREELERTLLLEELTEFRGRDGKIRPRKYRRIIANTPKEVAVAQEVILKLPPSAEGKILDTTTAKRRARRAPRNKPPTPAPTPSPSEDIRLYHCRFQGLADKAGLQPGSVNLVCTDFPYGKDFLPQLPDLAAFAADVLVDGGLFVTYSGNLYLDQVMAAFSRHLTYRWTLPSIWQGPARWLRCINVNTRWKPVLLFSKGRFPDIPQWRDVLQFDGREKDHHEWQQNLEEVEQLIRNFSKPGDVVVDPCGGSFSSAVACRNLGRRFIGCDIDQECVARGRERLQSTPCRELEVFPSHLVFSTVGLTG